MQKKYLNVKQENAFLTRNYLAAKTHFEMQIPCNYNALWNIMECNATKTRSISLPLKENVETLIMQQYLKRNLKMH